MPFRNFRDCNRKGNTMKKKTVLVVAEWILVAFFAFCALGNGFRPSSLLLVLAALLSAPIKPVRKFLSRFKIKDWHLITAAVILLFACAVISGQNTDTVTDFSDATDTVYESEYISAEESSAKEENEAESESQTAAKNEKNESKESKKAETVLSELEETSKAQPVGLSDIPPYSGSIYVTVNGNKPVFSAGELKTVGYEIYSELDSLGRCGTATASCGKDTMPKDGEERGSISDVYPSGWKQAKYEGISGGWLWNRCHLIGWQLSAENANRRNLITGTRCMNVDGMLPFENMVADYIKETGNHVAYRVTPIYDGDNLVCSGVQMEAYSVEDKGEGIEFNVFCYNVQPNISINYKTGDSEYTGGTKEETTSVSQSDNSSVSVIDNSTTETYILNTNTKKFHKSTCSSVKKISSQNYAESSESKETLISQGYVPCKNCFK